MTIVVGWDLCENTQPPTPLSAGKALKEIKLARGSGNAPTTTPTVSVDVWGLDPRLNVVGMLDWRNPANPGDPPDHDPSGGGGGVNVSATLAVAPIRQRPEGSICVYGPMELWTTASPVAVPNKFELATALPGVRITAYVTPIGATTSELVLTLLARPNERLGCDGLVEEIIRRIRVDAPSSPVSF